MANGRMRITVAALAVATECLLSARGWAEGGLSAPAGYQPGWTVEVRKAGSELDRPAGERLTSFVAPAAGFDMGSYRDTSATRYEFGLAYAALGMLNVPAAGDYRIGVAAAWTAAPGETDARCGLRLTVAGKIVADWRGPITADAGRRAPQGDIALQPGLHPAELKVACDRALGARLGIAVLIKAPPDRDLRPAGPVDIVHGPGTPAAILEAAVAPASPPARPPAGPIPLGAAPPPALPEAAPPQPVPGAATLVTTIDLSIHDQPDRHSRRIGRLVVGQAVAVAGPAPDPAWVQLAQGGYVEAGYLKPADQAGPARPVPGLAQPGGPLARYRVGDCRPYPMSATMVGGPVPIQGTVCLQPDGAWRVVNRQP